MTTKTDDATYVTSTARAIVRCTRKDCRRAYRLDFTTTTRHFAFNNRPAQTRTVTGAGVTNAPYRDRHDLAHILTRHFECLDCHGTSASFDVVQGSFSETVKCGARCGPVSESGGQPRVHPPSRRGQAAPSPLPVRGRTS